MNEGDRWYTVFTRPNQDEVAVRNLARQGYRVYRATYQRLKKGKLHTESLFPRYIFMQLSNADNWYPIRSTRGVVDIVRFGAVIPTLDNHFIEEVRRCEDNARESMKDQVHLTPGKRVKVRTHYTQLDAIFQEMSSSQRVVVLMDLLNGHRTMTVPLSSVSVA